MNFFLIGGKNESLCEYSCFAVAKLAPVILVITVGAHPLLSFLEVNYDGCFGLLMAGCGVAMIISLGVLIKSFKEDW
jgi:hypothetical protein